MRKMVAPLLLGIGGFCLTTALLLLVWVPGQVKKTPLNTNSVTRLAGDAVYLDAPRVPVKASSHTVVDGPASSGDTVVYQTFTCLVSNRDGAATNCESADGRDSRLLNAGTDAFATDRVSALALEDQEKFVGADASPHDGLVNKFPFDVEQKTYPFWDGILDRAVDATFQGEEQVLDLPTYKFATSVADEPAEISTGVQGSYSIDKTLWIDPVTGAIIKQSEHQVRTLPDGGTALDMNLAFTDETVAANVKSATDNGNKLRLIARLPWIVGLAGVVLSLLGLLLMRGRDSDVGGVTTRSETTQPIVPFGRPATEGVTPPAASGATATGATQPPPSRVRLEKD